MTSNVLYEPLIRSYEQFKYFTQTWNTTTSKKINVYHPQSKHYEFQPQKDPKNVASKKELKKP